MRRPRFFPSSSRTEERSCRVSPVSLRSFFGFLHGGRTPASWGHQRCCGAARQRHPATALVAVAPGVGLHGRASCSHQASHRRLQLYRRAPLAACCQGRCGCRGRCGPARNKASRKAHSQYRPGHVCTGALRDRGKPHGLSRPRPCAGPPQRRRPIKRGAGRVVADQAGHVARTS